MNRYSRVCANIDMDAILFNLSSMHKNLKDGTKIVGVIKTDGYGHGAVPIAWEMEKLDYVSGYAVATPEEAFQLRAEGIKKPILVLGYAFPESYPQMIRKDIRPAVFRQDMLRELDQMALSEKKICRIHIKVDTGMSRIGIPTGKEGLFFMKEALSYQNLLVEGLFTHFARADEADKGSAFRQLADFLEFADLVERETGYKIPLRHCSNSAAIIEMKEANLDLVRAGITLYGIWPSDEVDRSIISLKPALSLISHIVYIKTIQAGTPVSYGGTFVADHTMKIATIPVGYGDGYPRSLSGKGYVLTGGKKAPIVGRICMDQFMVDVTDIPDCREGDKVILIGEDHGNCITIEEIAKSSGRFSYELACDIGKRVPRVFWREEKAIAAKDYYTDVRIEKIR